MSITLYTFNDMVEHLADTYDVQRSGRLLRNCRRAVKMACREIPHVIRWKYFDRRYVLLSAASQSTGTIAYDQTGGANEREVTLIGSTFPAGAEQYRIIIGRGHYNVGDRISSTVVTLAADSNPGSDVVAGTSYALYKSNYRLPEDFRKIGSIWDVDNELPIGITTTDTQQSDSVYIYDTPNQPLRAAIRADGEYISELKLIFSPPPDIIREYDITYEAKSRPIKVEKHISGTVSTTAASTTVTGSSTTAFTQAMVGSVIRFSGDGKTLPTSVLGDVDGNMNLFTEQGIVKSITNSTVLEMREAATNTAASVKYMISDPIDIELDAMLTVFHRRMESEYERLSRLKTKSEAFIAYRQALVEAMESDQRSSSADESVGPLSESIWRSVRTGLGD